MIKKGFEFILASQSPRRKQLLADAGYKFRVVVSDVDEDAFSKEGVDSCEFAKKLAMAKAKAVAVKHPEDIVLAADTIVDLDGHIIGKADDEGQAEEIVRKLFSKPHKVITGVAVLHVCKSIEIVTVDSTTVYPREMSDEQIDAHIAGGSWVDKAGAYAIQETGDEFVERIEGSLTNVMGLPMEMVADIFSKLASQ